MADEIKEVIAQAKAEEEEIGKTIYSLQKVHDAFKKWYYIKDLQRIDVMLAVALTREIIGTKVWLIFVGDSGDMKSAQLGCLDNPEIAYLTKKFTPKTLVSGFKQYITTEGGKRKLINLDLAPKLDNKILLIPEMAQILTLHPSLKAEIWSQLRDLYDGYAGTETGSGVSKIYKDLNVTLLAGSTPAIDYQILIHQSLGTRELIYRTISEEGKLQEYIEQVSNNEEHEQQAKQECKDAVQGFLKEHKYNEDIKLPEQIKKQIIKQAEFLSYMRATAQSCSFTGELKSNVQREKISRVFKIFKRLYKALKSLDKDYSDEQVMNCITHIVESSVNQIRVKVFDGMCQDSNENWTYNKMSKAVRLGMKTVKKELQILWNLGLVEREDNKTDTGNLWHIWKLNLAHRIVMYRMEVPEEEDLKD